MEVRIPNIEELTNPDERRHFESFKRSMEEWQNYEANRSGASGEATDDFIKALVTYCAENGITSKAKFEKAIYTLRKEKKITPSKPQLIASYQKLLKTGELAADPLIEQFLIKKIVRTASGVIVITVLTSPGPFSCPKDCHYCPKEPGQPRSYLSTEPAVLRANQNGWDAVSQFNDRAGTLQRNGHTVDKIEILVLGGTWSGYPRDYQEEFVRDLFYAANIFHDVPDETLDECAKGAAVKGKRAPLSLEEEQRRNETAQARIIGVTLETRPDFINKYELNRLRRFGCTRVQIGVQHTDNEILEKINRGHSVEHAVKAVQLLKDSCFKVDIHLMPDLPGSDPERDLKMFNYVLHSPDLQADQWKIYPCEVTPFSEIEKWYKRGEYEPYADREGGRLLLDLLCDVKSKVHPWIRLNRVIRDIPNQTIIAGNQHTNLRQMIDLEMKRRGLVCRCIRCREVKDLNSPEVSVTRAVLKERKYATLGGSEFFLSFELPDESRIFAFLRLRLREGERIEKEKRGEEGHFAIKELKGAALLRELHVYGVVVGVGESKGEGDSRSQHAGFGWRLVKRAEEIAYSHGFRRMAIIAGVGTRRYYAKFGYVLEGTFMTKDLTPDSIQWTEDSRKKRMTEIESERQSASVVEEEEDEEADVTHMTPIEEQQAMGESLDAEEEAEEEEAAGMGGASTVAASPGKTGEVEVVQRQRDGQPPSLSVAWSATGGLTGVVGWFSRTSSIGGESEGTGSTTGQQFVTLAGAAAALAALAGAAAATVAVLRRQPGR
uniref:tRNA carboxymethyluridine synthase n=1 Tax=Chromera velia CCMP2878 TaxID=1169474 RepID=A0A0G4I3R9_9ALVE|eukprot:Cvel_10742.t1-p1 / transcript=Cvel_10742.t1 / gene=Cvel_10742 / organism=Chromera_velia_CCMP2878 / gene_product=Uncharacterized protein MJ1136, putative / transcript_product=Uncharacterized protein MJ1136, putative / location=Cvel_scaffold655:15342-21942(-) / protein_length=775 / sequence_SO=supercontig / SO=protein_coding / is_pseudo=false